MFNIDKKLVKNMRYCLISLFFISTLLPTYVFGSIASDVKKLATMPKYVINMDGTTKSTNESSTTNGNKANDHLDAFHSKIIDQNPHNSTMQGRMIYSKTVNGTAESLREKHLQDVTETISSNRDPISNQIAAYKKPTVYKDENGRIYHTNNPSSLLDAQKVDPKTGQTKQVYTDTQKKAANDYVLTISGANIGSPTPQYAQPTREAIQSHAVNSFLQAHMNSAARTHSNSYASNIQQPGLDGSGSITSANQHQSDLSIGDSQNPDTMNKMNNTSIFGQIGTGVNQIFSTAHTVNHISKTADNGATQLSNTNSQLAVNGQLAYGNQYHQKALASQQPKIQSNRQRAYR